MKRFPAVLLVLFASTFGGVCVADPVKLPKELEMVPPDGLFMASVDFTTVWDHAAFSGLRKGLEASREMEDIKKFCGHTLGDLARATIVLKLPEDRDPNRRFIQPEPIILLTMKKPIDRAAVLKAGKYYTIVEMKEIVKSRKSSSELPPPSGKTDATHYVSREAHAVMAFADDRTMAFWSPKGIGPQREENIPSPLVILKAKAETGPLAEGRILAAQHPLALAVNMSGMKVLAEGEPIPDDIIPLLRADAVLGYANLNKSSADVVASANFAGKQWATDGEDAAKKLQTLAVLVMKEDAKRTIKREGAESTIGQFAMAFAGMVEKMTIQRDENTVKLTGTIDLGPDMQKLLAAIPAATTEGAAVAMSSNNLKQIALAFHNHESAFQYLPSNSYDKDGKPLLSWRVHILPYLEQDELYKQFKLDEPWDSDTNKKLIEKMPKIYALPATKTKQPGQTFYRSFVSKKDAAMQAVMVEGRMKGPSIVGITDGTSNTFLCVEAEESCSWTKPDDLVFDPDGKLPKLGGHLVKDRFAVAFCDGSVRMMNSKMPAEKLKAYITTNGGEVIQDD